MDRVMGRVVFEVPDGEALKLFELLLTAAAILRHWPAEAVPPSRATLHRWLAGAVERGWLCWEADDRRNAPYRYRLPDPEEL